MARRPRWWHQLEASKNEALLAVDLYNRPTRERQLEAFIVHMILAWLKLLQAKYMRDRNDLYIRDPKGRRKRGPDGDWMMKPLAALISEVFSKGDPVRVNVEFFIGLRNKIEHSYDHEVAYLVSGKCQSLLINYERAVVNDFGADEGLADRLHFPLFVSTITNDAVDAIKNAWRRVPKSVMNYVQNFDAELDPDVGADQRYDLRIYLVPKTGPKTAADIAMSFVRLDDLNEEQAALMEKMQTVIRDKQIPVADLDSLLASQVVERVDPQIPWTFTVNDHTAAWRYWDVRPPGGAEQPERTSSDFCRYNRAFKRYVYTAAWVKFLARELSDRQVYREVTGREPIEADGDVESQFADTSESPASARPSSYEVEADYEPGTQSSQGEVGLGSGAAHVNDGPRSG
jgi:hypothetical protein